MDIENKYEVDLIFDIELEDKKEDKLKKTKKILKIARSNFKKLTIDRLSGKTGIC